jgi:TatD DNase family protein
MITDSHCHIDTEPFDADRDAVIARAAAAQVSQMIVIGAGGALSDCDRALDLVRQHPHLWASVGVHPHHADGCDSATLSAISERANDPKVVAIGETGLDFFYDTCPRDAQIEAFRAFIRMGHAHALPLVLHIRDAHKEAKAILAEEGASEIGGVVHCFTGTVQDAEDYLALGFHLGITGILTFKRSGDLPTVVKHAPVDRLLVETDSPYLAPHPHRGTRNEPAFVPKVVEAIAAIRNTPVETIAAITTENANRLFSLPS